MTLRSLLRLIPFDSVERLEIDTQASHRCSGSNGRPHPVVAMPTTRHSPARSAVAAESVPPSSGALTAHLARRAYTAACVACCTAACCVRRGSTWTSCVAAAS